MRFCGLRAPDTRGGFRSMENHNIGRQRSGRRAMPMSKAHHGSRVVIGTAPFPFAPHGDASKFAKSGRNWLQDEVSERSPRGSNYLGQVFERAGTSAGIPLECRIVKN